MGKRYYCQYCNRAFLDNLNARKKHLASAAHHQQREAWYDKFKDKRQRLTEQLEKPRVCRYYLQQGSCAFGPSCRYRHMTDDEVDKVKRELDEEDLQKQQSPQDSDRTVQSWLDNRANSRRGSPPSQSSDDKSQTISYIIPEGILSLPSVPPSLLPPPHGSWPQYPDIDWG